MGETDESLIGPEESRRGMRLAVMAQCFGVALLFALTRGGLAVLYAQRFGAGDFMVGMIIGSMGVGAAAALFFPQLIERYNKRAVLVASLLVGVVSALPLPLLPYLEGYASHETILAIMAASLLGQGCSQGGLLVTWFVALRDFVPTRGSGRFFGRLRMSWQVTALGVSVLCYFVLRGAAVPVSRFQIILAVLILGLIVRVFLVQQFPQRAVAPSGLRGAVHRLRTMWADAPYRAFVIFSVAMMTLVRAVYPSIIVFAKALGYSDGEVVLAGCAGMAGAAAGFGLWGRVSDRHGSGRVYRISMALACLALLLWLPISYAAREAGLPGPAYGLILLSLCLFGAAEAGVSVGTSRHSFQLTPTERVPTYLALFPCLMFVGSGVAMFLAGSGFETVRASESTGWLNPYVAVFAINGLGCLAMIPLVRRVAKSGEVG